MKFDGKEYYGSGWKRTKAEANKHAEWIRSRGGFGRVVPEVNNEKKGYSIYRRGGY